MKTMKNKNTGTTFLSILVLIFITLKLLDKIDWSWWWVLAPLWIPVSVLLLILGSCGVAIRVYERYKR